MPGDFPQHLDQIWKKFVEEIMSHNLVNNHSITNQVISNILPMIIIFRIIPLHDCIDCLSIKALLEL
jgi:hypothetical protein